MFTLSLEKRDDSLLKWTAQNNQKRAKDSSQSWEFDNQVFNENDINNKNNGNSVEYH